MRWVGGGGGVAFCEEGEDGAGGHGGWGRDGDRGGGDEDVSYGSNGEGCACVAVVVGLVCEGGRLGKDSVNSVGDEATRHPSWRSKSGKNG